jgi:outer membrane cobalamin receptor
MRKVHNHPPNPRHARAVAAVLALSSSAACSQSAEAPQPADASAAVVAASQLDQVEITGRHQDNTVGTSDAASQGIIRAELLKSRPAQRHGEVLQFVPGMIVTQHSGSGKANQYFLRGLTLDHGTDFATSVNGLPVNMPTHGHGQGYSDLNFLIPELVDRIEYRKGPYFARRGSAGRGSPRPSGRTSNGQAHPSDWLLAWSVHKRR